MKQGQFPAILPLASLNGQNGFKIDGEGGDSGVSVSAVGDINGDGHNDLAIGAYVYGSSTQGRSYVVFGGPGVGSSGMFSLSSLNGTNGFKLDGENSGDRSGTSISGTGDINGDGYADLIIGATGYGSSKGRSYVMFGGLGVGSSGIFSLFSLNGANGFKLDGENNSDQSGYSIDATGDINRDGYADLIIGAIGYGSGKGRSYVVFGGSGVGSNGVFSLSSLNGTNGFKLDGENNSDQSGYSVDTGDINGDRHADLIIGANGYGSGKGRSYVVFGGPGIGNNGMFSLSSLNGANGFKLDGENNQDYSGQSVSVTGDINGDGYADLIIGAIGYGSGKGRSYMVFGGPGVGGSGVFSLSSLNGINGFKLDGEYGSDDSGISVSAAGDINGDGYADLIIGADNYLGGGNKGRSYVVFGGSGMSSSGILNLSNLNGANGFKLDGENNQDYSGQSVSVAGDINGDGYTDLIIGANGYGSAKGRSYVVFGDVPPVLVNNSLSLSVGAAIQLNSTLLAAYDRNHNNNTLVFVPSAVTRGQFEAISKPGVPLVNFTQQQITSGTIQFVHDGSLVAPSYNITVRSTGIAWTGPFSAKINFIGTPQSYFPAILPLASLNGQNGFKLDGENSNDQSGYSVSAAGDINGDSRADLLIGDYCHLYVSLSCGTGRSYVVFGGPGAGRQGLLSLSSLNGTNGFKLDGEATGDWSGSSVSAAGDINGDGRADLLVGAYAHASYTGRSYVVFGGSGVGSSGTILLSSLNGVNGFKLDGEASNDQSGNSVSAAGDINGDGRADLLIGADGHVSAGRSYVVFGGPTVGSGGTILLSSLSGANGFKLDGEASDDQSGVSVGTVGDINGDGWVDLLIGAPLHASSAGRSYMVFGGPTVGSGGTIPLSSLNGANGFKLDGEASGDESGISVSAAGDINGDGYDDLVIGAHGYGSGRGRSYVVFGGPTVGSGGIIPLLGLNGANGFKLDGEASGDYSGFSVSTAGDINGDGYADLLIGANQHASHAGRSYVVFGGPTVGNSGTIPLSSLNGANGFKLDGEASSDDSGYSVSAAGDINGDGVVDILIGAYGHNNVGRSYVVFGDIPPTLVQNRLTLQSGSKVSFNSTFLSVYDRNHKNNTLIFFPTNVIHGHFENVKQPGVSLTNFTQPQLLNGTVQFVHDGSLLAPSYHITVRSAGIAWTGPVPANISFIPSTTTAVPITTSPTSTTVSTPTLVVTSTSTPSSAQTTTPAVTSAPMTTTIPTQAATTIIMSTSASTSQTPSTVQTPMPSVTSVSTSTVIQTTTPAITSTSTPTVTPTSTPISAPPVLLTNQLTLSNGQTVILLSSNLQASEVGFNNSQLIFVVGNVQNGYFSTVPTSKSVAKNLTSFTQAQIQSSTIEFIHASNSQAPSYSILVSDGVQSTLPSAAVIHFAGAPIITQNTLNITAGGTITLTPALLNVTVTDGSAPSQVMITVSNLQHATITSTLTGTPVNNFTLAALQAGDIHLTDDGSLITPSYTITAQSGKGISSAPNLPLVYFSNQGVYAPQWVNNYLLVGQGEATVLSNRYLLAVQPDSQAVNNSTMFYVSKVEYGHFSLTQAPQTWITSFSQQQLLEGQVQFVQDGSAATPEYQVEAEVLGLQSASRWASIFFKPNNELLPSPSPSPSPASSGDTGYSTVEKAIIGAVISGTIGIVFAVLQACLKRAANKKLLQALGTDTSDFDMKVVSPVAREIARQVKITGFMNYTTNTEMAHFKSAVRSILFELDKQGVNLNFSEMSEIKREGLINEIARQTRVALSKNKGGCSKVTSFFKCRQARPKDIEEAAVEIAAAVAKSLTRDSAVNPKPHPLELPELSSSKSTLWDAKNSSQVPPASPSSVEPLRQERESSQILGS